MAGDYRSELLLRICKRLCSKSGGGGWIEALLEFHEALGRTASPINQCPIYSLSDLTERLKVSERRLATKLQAQHRLKNPTFHKRLPLSFVLQLTIWSHQWFESTRLRQERLATPCPVRFVKYCGPHLFLTAADDGFIKLYDAHSSLLSISLKRHFFDVSAILPLPSHNLLISGCGLGHVRVWHLPPQAHWTPLFYLQCQGRIKLLTTFQASPQNLALIVVTQLGHINVFSLTHLLITYHHSKTDPLPDHLPDIPLNLPDLSGLPPKSRPPQSATAGHRAKRQLRGDDSDNYDKLTPEYPPGALCQDLEQATLLTVTTQLPPNNVVEEAQCISTLADTDAVAVLVITLGATLVQPEVTQPRHDTPDHENESVSLTYQQSRLKYPIIQRGVKLQKGQAATQTPSSRLPRLLLTDNVKEVHLKWPLKDLGATTISFQIRFPQNLPATLPNNSPATAPASAIAPTADQEVMIVQPSYRANSLKSDDRREERSVVTRIANLQNLSHGDCSSRAIGIPNSRRVVTVSDDGLIIIRTYTPDGFTEDCKRLYAPVIQAVQNSTSQDPTHSSKTPPKLNSFVTATTLTHNGRFLLVAQAIISGNSRSRTLWKSPIRSSGISLINIAQGTVGHTILRNDLKHCVSLLVGNPVWSNYVLVVSRSGQLSVVDICKRENCRRWTYEVGGVEWLCADWHPSGTEFVVTQSYGCFSIFSPFEGQAPVEVNLGSASPYLSYVCPRNPRFRGTPLTQFMKSDFTPLVEVELEGSSASANSPQQILARNSVRSKKCAPGYLYDIHYVRQPHQLGSEEEIVASDRLAHTSQKLVPLTFHGLGSIRPPPSSSFSFTKNPRILPLLINNREETDKYLLEERGILRICYPRLGYYASNRSREELIFPRFIPARMGGPSIRDLTAEESRPTLDEEEEMDVDWVDTSGNPTSSSSSSSSANTEEEETSSSSSSATSDHRPRLLQRRAAGPNTTNRSTASSPRGHQNRRLRLTATAASSTSSELLPSPPPHPRPVIRSALRQRTERSALPEPPEPPAPPGRRPGVIDDNSSADIVEEVSDESPLLNEDAEWSSSSSVAGAESTSEGGRHNEDASLVNRIKAFREWMVERATAGKTELLLTLLPSRELPCEVVLCRLATLWILSGLSILGATKNRILRDHCLPPQLTAPKTAPHLATALHQWTSRAGQKVTGSWTETLKCILEQNRLGSAAANKCLFCDQAGNEIKKYRLSSTLVKLAPCMSSADGNEESSLIGKVLHKLCKIFTAADSEEGIMLELVGPLQMTHHREDENLSMPFFLHRGCLRSFLPGGLISSLPGRIPAIVDMSRLLRMRRQQSRGPMTRRRVSEQPVSLESPYFRDCGSCSGHAATLTCLFCPRTYHFTCALNLLPAQPTINLPRPVRVLSPKALLIYTGLLVCPDCSFAYLWPFLISSANAASLDQPIKPRVGHHHQIPQLGDLCHCNFPQPLSRLLDLSTNPFYAIVTNTQFHFAHFKLKTDDLVELLLDKLISVDNLVVNSESERREALCSLLKEMTMQQLKELVDCAYEVTLSLLVLPPHEAAGAVVSVRLEEGDVESGVVSMVSQKCTTESLNDAPKSRLFPFELVQQENWGGGLVRRRLQEASLTEILKSTSSNASAEPLWKRKFFAGPSFLAALRTTAALIFKPDAATVERINNQLRFVDNALSISTADVARQLLSGNSINDRKVLDTIVSIDESSLSEFGAFRYPLPVPTVSVLSRLPNKPRQRVSLRVSTSATANDEPEWVSAYATEIPVATCLQTILRRLKKGFYHSHFAFWAELDLMCHNAITFNGHGDKITNAAIALARSAYSLYTSDLPRPSELVMFKDVKTQPFCYAKAALEALVYRLHEMDYDEANAFLKHSIIVNPPSSSSIPRRIAATRKRRVSSSGSSTEPCIKSARVNQSS